MITREAAALLQEATLSATKAAAHPEDKKLAKIAVVKQVQADLAVGELKKESAPTGAEKEHAEAELEEVKVRAKKVSVELPF